MLSHPISYLTRAHGKNRRKTPMPTDTTGTSNDVIVDYDGPSMHYPEDSIVPAALVSLPCLPRFWFCSTARPVI